MVRNKKRDAFPLKVPAELGEFIRKFAKHNRRNINEELNIALEEYRDRNKFKTK